MKIAICDDDKIAIDIIQMKIEQHGNKDLVTTFSSTEQITSDKMREFDVIFLDIEMPGIDGMEMAELLRARQEDIRVDPFGSLPLIIFITGYKDYMGRAFAVNAFEYLVKPVSDEVFERVYKRARKFVLGCNKEKCVVTIKSAGKTHMVSTSNIKYIESINRKNIIHFHDDKELEYYGTMNALGTELADNFFRIHKGYIVNMAYVIRYDRVSVTVSGEKTLLMSKYRYQDFLNVYMDYLKKKEELV